MCCKSQDISSRIRKIGTVLARFGHKIALPNRFSGLNYRGSKNLTLSHAYHVSASKFSASCLD